MEYCPSVDGWINALETEQESREKGARKSKGTEAETSIQKGTGTCCMYTRRFPASKIPHCYLQLLLGLTVSICNKFVQINKNNKNNIKVIKIIFFFSSLRFNARRPTTWPLEVAESSTTASLSVTSPRSTKTQTNYTHPWWTAPLCLPCCSRVRT